MYAGIIAKGKQKAILYKAQMKGIKVNLVNEAYTSKTSSISGNIINIQELSKDRHLSTDDFKGNRVKRGLFLDTEINKILNADCNAGCNICKLNMENNSGKEGKRWFKLCNPRKFKSDYDLCKFLHNSKFG